jgi:hypothetical protein
METEEAISGKSDKKPMPFVAFAAYCFFRFRDQPVSLISLLPAVGRLKFIPAKLCAPNIGESDLLPSFSCAFSPNQLRRRTDYIRQSRKLEKLWGSICHLSNSLF